MEEKELNINNEIDEENKRQEVDEMVKITRILQDLLENKITNIIQSELRKNKVESDLEIEVKIDVDFYK